MSIVVTGATGHLGALIIDHLLERGTDPADLVAAGRNLGKLAAFEKLGLRTAVIDFAAPETLEAAFAGADVLMLVSGNELGQRAVQHANAIEAAKAKGVGRIVYTSAPKATTSALILAPDHKATEEALQASGVPFTILRNGWYTENFAAAIEPARNTGTFLTSAGEGRTASASRTDYAEAAAVVLTAQGHENAIYELSGDYAWTGDEFATALSEVLGGDVAHVSVSPAEHTATLIAAGLDEATAGFVVALDANTRDGLLAETSGELARLIGRPTTPLLEGLRSVA